jgi:hypothetical protein
MYTFIVLYIVFKTLLHAFFASTHVLLGKVTLPLNCSCLSVLETEITLVIEQNNFLVKTLIFRIFSSLPMDMFDPISTKLVMPVGYWFLRSCYTHIFFLRTHLFSNKVTRAPPSCLCGFVNQNNKNGNTLYWASVRPNGTDPPALASCASCALCLMPRVPVASCLMRPTRAWRLHLTRTRCVPPHLAPPASRADSRCAHHRSDLRAVASSSIPASSSAFTSVQWGATSR